MFIGTGANGSPGLQMPMMLTPEIMLNHNNHHVNTNGISLPPNVAPINPFSLSQANFIQFAPVPPGSPAVQSQYINLSSTAGQQLHGSNIHFVQVQTPWGPMMQTVAAGGAYMAVQQQQPKVGSSPPASLKGHEPSPPPATSNTKTAVAEDGTWIGSRRTLGFRSKLRLEEKWEMKGRWMEKQLVFSNWLHFYSGAALIIRISESYRTTQASRNRVTWLEKY